MSAVILIYCVLYDDDIIYFFYFLSNGVQLLMLEIVITFFINV